MREGRGKRERVCHKDSQREDGLEIAAATGGRGGRTGPYQAPASQTHMHTGNTLFLQLNALVRNPYALYGGKTSQQAHTKGNKEMQYPARADCSTPEQAAHYTHTHVGERKLFLCKLEKLVCDLS